VLIDGVDEAAALREMIEELVVCALAPLGFRIAVTSRPEGVEAGVAAGAYDDFALFGLCALTDADREHVIQQQVAGNEIYHHLSKFKAIRDEHDRAYDADFNPAERRALETLSVPDRLVVQGGDGDGRCKFWSAGIHACCCCCCCCAAFGWNCAGTNAPWFWLKCSGAYCGAAGTPPERCRVKPACCGAAPYATRRVCAANDGKFPFPAATAPTLCPWLWCVPPRCASIEGAGAGATRTLETPAGARSANIRGAAPSTRICSPSAGRAAVSSNAASDASMSSVPGTLGALGERARRSAFKEGFCADRDAAMEGLP